MVKQYLLGACDVLGSQNEASTLWKQVATRSRILPYYKGLHLFILFPTFLKSPFLLLSCPLCSLLFSQFSLFVVSASYFVKTFAQIDNQPMVYPYSETLSSIKKQLPSYNRKTWRKLRNKLLRETNKQQKKIQKVHILPDSNCTTF